MREGMTRPIEDTPGYRWVAWHGGGAVKLRIGKRHITTDAAIEGSAPRKTLCGLTWKRSKETPTDKTWTDGDCTRCARALEKAASSSPS